ncbi:DNA polymerase III subunit epsilon [Methylomarinovum tepidoasis]|uniref:DNA polymerase III subunit epsilon n=1 Tax=Methylomarinovum tepidoasis TaxID=2840183 RepID=A0AAU9C4X6_9GAMM|nr:DNA polymerase III subunit epsilon [Methylomarinovum sp. IN45]BCX88204.1 DNA polymerase III subunit epsilon [Methylomarinovum sp. IN45]
MRQIVLDTETTGLDPAQGHRIIEIGCVELVDRRLTDNRYHVYLNPEREIDQGAVDVHGIDNAFLADKPRFADIVDDFLAFVKDSEVIIHNAPFDVGFINAELARLGSDYGRLEDYCTIFDTLTLARRKHPGQRNSLDALCKRYQIDNSHRELHGALLDAEILAAVYLAMTGGQVTLGLDTLPADTAAAGSASRASRPRPALKRVTCPEPELEAHRQRLQAIDQASGGNCLWLRYG